MLHDVTLLLHAWTLKKTNGGEAYRRKTGKKSVTCFGILFFDRLIDQYGQLDFLTFYVTLLPVTLWWRGFGV
jgi:hypothetical protein